MSRLWLDLGSLEEEEDFSLSEREMKGKVILLLNKIK